jgi:antitoxin component YwqK of YwqJK toxin-antitoxin module
MKSILFSILFLLVPKLALSQSSTIDRKIYLDSTWNETTSEKYQYYRIVKDYYSSKDLYVINDYYKSGVLQMEGTSKTKDDVSKEGEFIFYYENGNKKAVTNYINSRPNGRCFEWYENGNKKLEGEYIEDKKKHTNQHKINQFWNENGVQKVIDENGYFDGKEGFGRFEEISKGEMKNGFKEGIWEGISKKPDNSYTETYKNGKLISGVSTDKNGTTYSYSEIEIRPEPKKGMTDFYKYIGKNFRITEVKGLNGKIYITFVIDEVGKIVEPKIRKDLGYGTGQKALRVITEYQGFTPGVQRGRKVRCHYSIPISLQSPY